MMKFDIITIFPNIFDSYFSESILKRAQDKNKIEIDVHNLRDFATDKHETVDDTPYGGGAGMVMKVEPIFNCVSNIKEQASPESKTRTILFSAKGKRFTQADARRLSEYDQIIMICGRYEGVDERVAEHIADEEISIGDYVLTGGEVPAMAVTDSVSRLIPGVLGNPESLNEESFGKHPKHQEHPEHLQQLEQLEHLQHLEHLEHKEYPQYTKPEDFNSWTVPEVLLSGNHKEIEKWRKQKQNQS